MHYKFYDEMFEDKNLTHGEIRVLAVINTFTEMNGVAYLSYSKLERFIDRKYINKVLTKLIEYGYIEKIKQSHYKCLIDYNSRQMGIGVQTGTSMQMGTATSGQKGTANSRQTGTKIVGKGVHRKNIKNIKNHKKEKSLSLSLEDCPADGSIPNPTF